MGLVNDRLCLHDFRFQAGCKGYDLTALRFGHLKRVEAHSKTAHEGRVVGFCNAHTRLTRVLLATGERFGNPLDVMGIAYFFKRQFDEAASKLLLSIQDHPGFPSAY